MNVSSLVLETALSTTVCLRLLPRQNWRIITASWCRPIRNDWYGAMATVVLELGRNQEPPHRRTDLLGALDASGPYGHAQLRRGYPHCCLAHGTRASSIVQPALCVRRPVLRFDCGLDDAHS